MLVLIILQTLNVEKALFLNLSFPYTGLTIRVIWCHIGYLNIRMMLIGLWRVSLSLTDTRGIMNTLLPEQINEIRELRANGSSLGYLVQLFDVSQYTIRNKTNFVLDSDFTGETILLGTERLNPLSTYKSVRTQLSPSNPNYTQITSLMEAR